MPMDRGQLQMTSHRNVRVVPVEPHVKSAETRKLFNRGVIGNSKTGKTTDPTCYNLPTVELGTGLFDNVEMKMKSDMMKPIRKYFTVETAPRQTDKWLITCEKCGNMWHLKKDNEHPGNVLHLLNHARSHDEPKPHSKRKQAVLDALNG